MSFAAMSWAQTQRPGNAVAKLVLYALANYADEDGSCFPSQKRLAEDCECSTRTVMRWLDHLEERGFIRRERRMNVRGERTSDRFYLSLGDNLSGDKFDGPKCQSVTPSKDEPITKTISLSPPAREEAPQDVLAEVLSTELAAALVHHRKELNRPLTGYTAGILARKLNEWPSPDEAAARMIDSGWSTFNPKWMGKTKPTTPVSAEDTAKAGEESKRPPLAPSAPEASADTITVTPSHHPRFFEECLAVLRLQGKDWAWKGGWKFVTFPTAFVEQARRNLQQAKGSVALGHR